MAFHYFKYFSSSCNQVSEFDQHIRIYQFCHRNYILFGLIEVTGNMLRCLSVTVKVSKIADPVGTFEQQCIPGTIFEYPLQILGL